MKRQSILESACKSIVLFILQYGLTLTAWIIGLLYRLTRYLALRCAAARKSRCQLAKTLDNPAEKPAAKVRTEVESRKKTVLKLNTISRESWDGICRNNPHLSEDEILEALGKA